MNNVGMILKNWKRIASIQEGELFCAKGDDIIVFRPSMLNYLWKKWHSISRNSSLDFLINWYGKTREMVDTLVQLCVKKPVTLPAAAGSQGGGGGGQAAAPPLRPTANSAAAMISDLDHKHATDVGTLLQDSHKRNWSVYELSLLDIMRTLHKAQDGLELICRHYESKENEDRDYVIRLRELINHVRQLTEHIVHVFRDISPRLS